MLPLIPVLLVLILRGSAGAGNPTRAQLSAAIQALHRLSAAPESEMRSRAMAMASDETSESPEAIYSILCEAASRTSEPVLPLAEPTVAQPLQPHSDKPADGFSECRRSRDGPASR